MLQLDVLRTKLEKHWLRDARGEPVKTAPRWVELPKGGDSSKTRPHLWLDSPQNSVVLEVIADVRLIQSKEFAAQRSLRFPRVKGIRADKNWTCVMTDKELANLVEENRGRLASGAAVEHGGERGRGTKRKAGAAGSGQAARSRRPVVPARLRPVDTSGVEIRSTVMEGVHVAFVGVDSGSVDALSKQLVALGGGQDILRSGSTTHIVVPDPPSGPPWGAAAAGWESRVRRLWTQSVSAAAARSKDSVHATQTQVVSLSWLSGCLDDEALLPVLPRHLLYLPHGPVGAHPPPPGCDEFGDPLGDAQPPQEEDVRSTVRLVVRRLDAAEAPPPPPDASLLAAVRDALCVPGLSLFRGVVAWVLPAPLLENEPAELVSLYAFDAATLQLRLRARGATTVARLQAGVTHIILTPHPRYLSAASPPLPTLESALDSAGAATPRLDAEQMRLLRRMLRPNSSGDRALAVVHASWVHRACEHVAQWEAAPPSSERASRGRAVCSAATMRAGHEADLGQRFRPDALAALEAEDDAAAARAEAAAQAEEAARAKRTRKVATASDPAAAPAKGRKGRAPDKATDKATTALPSSIPSAAPPTDSCSLVAAPHAPPLEAAPARALWDPEVERAEAEARARRVAALHARLQAAVAPPASQFGDEDDDDIGSLSFMQAR